MIKIKILSLLLFFSLNTFSQLNDSIIEAISNNFNIWNTHKIPELYHSELHANKEENPNSILFLSGGIQFKDNVQNHMSLSKISKYKNIAYFSYSYKGNLDNRIDFSWFPNIRVVNLESTINQKQVNQLFSTAKKLRYLVASINDTIPECFCELKELRVIQIIGSPIFPSCIKEMKNLKFINLIGGGENFKTFF
jgi:hypothetical protein